MDFFGLLADNIQMERYLKKQIQKDLIRKLILISGPRQTGKTTLAKSLSTSFEYLNYDSSSDKKKIVQNKWDREKEILILDELHKMKKWKLWLKGINDTERNHHIVVTGSAKLDTHKKVGDSMAGRYFQFNLLPLDLKELHATGYKNTKKNLEHLLILSGFPEPFLSGSEAFYKRWRKTHLDIIVKQDLVETETIKRISDVSTLVELMTERIGSPLSYNSLREDLLTDDKTVKRWMLALENAYVFFKVTPYFKSVKLAIRKAPKYYFFDYPRVQNEGARLENLVAMSLLKEILYRNDVLGEEYSLHYLQNKAQHEVDFLICKNKKPWVMVEVKSQDDTPSNNFKYFEKDLLIQNPDLKKVQLVKTLKRNFSTKDGLVITDLASWLEKMDW